MSKKLRYSTDEFNRLVINKDGKNYPIDGVFKVERNKLFFLPQRKTGFARELSLAERIDFEGRWHLTENYDLKLILVETQRQTKGDELHIKGQIVSVEADAILFGARFKKTEHEDKISVLSIGGRWRAGESNQQEFIVTKDYGEDILKFKGSWQINENQQIVYRYQKQNLLRKTKTEEFLTLKGFWQINTKNRLAYILDLKNKSFLEFKTQLENPTLMGSEGQIRYRIGIGARRLLKENRILLFGTWKISKQRSISFEMEYGKDGVRQIIFGASVYLNKNNEIIFELRNKKGDEVGISVGFQRQFFKKDGLLFARISKLEEDSRFEAGVKIRW